MASLTDIEYRIDQLDGGTFQRFCDAYLYLKGYKNQYSLGMHTGTNKTAKGNPDTYFKDENNKYIFVMYTTQKSSFEKKLLEDIEKCFNVEGISTDDISKIIFCHTNERVSVGLDKKVADICRKKGIELSLIGIDELTNDVHFNYPILAKEFLGLSIDTGQIMSLNRFICDNDKVEISAPLETKFCLREKELKKAKALLEERNILIISGLSGVGKTRFSLKLCEELKKEENAKVLCIRSNGLNLYDDITCLFRKNEKYILFLDDINEFKDFKAILDFLVKKDIDFKMIATVRNYAFENMKKIINEFFRFNLLKLDLFKSEEIEKIINENYEIKNCTCIDMIIDISKGNARLAMLLAKIVKDDKKTKSINSIDELYSCYYSKQIDFLHEKETLLVSLGIVSFIECIKLNCLDKLDDVFKVANIEKEQFRKDMDTLYELELVNIFDGKIVKIIDQAFGDYLIKYIFIDKKIISFKDMIKIYFFIDTERTIYICNTIMNVFADKELETFVKNEIINIWNEIKSDRDKFKIFFKSFYIIRPIETLVLLNEEIEKMSVEKYDVSCIKFKDNENLDTINDYIISILAGFKDTKNLSEAVDLLFKYYKKKPRIFKDFYIVCTRYWGIDHTSDRNNYYSIKIVIEKLNDFIRNNFQDNNVFLFIKIAEYYLKLGFSSTELYQKRKIRFWNISLPCTNLIIGLRESLWENLYKVYARDKFRIDIENILMKYSYDLRSMNEDLIKNDMQHFIEIFNYFDVNNIYHCIIAERIKDISESVNINYLKQLNPFLESKQAQIFFTFRCNDINTIEMDWEEKQKYFKQKISKLIKDYSYEDYVYLMKFLKRCSDESKKNKNIVQIQLGVQYFFEILDEKSDMYIKIVELYIKYNTPYNIFPVNILLNLFRLSSVEKVKELLTMCEYDQKNTWLWYYYMEIPEEYITLKLKDEFLGFISEIPNKDNSYLNRLLINLKKYKKVDKDIFVKFTNIILKNTKKYPYLWDMYFIPTFYNLETLNWIQEYDSNISLLEDIYLNCIERQNIDYEGKLFTELVEKDESFLYRFLDSIPERFKQHWEYISPLSAILKKDDFIEKFNEVFVYLCDKSSILNSKAYIIKELLDEESIEKQDACINEIIKKYNMDMKKICFLFESIVELAYKRRVKFISNFIRLNKNFNDFKKIQLHSKILSGWGSFIPKIQERIEFLKEIDKLFSGIDYLKHKQYIETQIRNCENHIKNEQYDEFLYGI